MLLLFDKILRKFKYDPPNNANILRRVVDSITNDQEILKRLQEAVFTYDPEVARKTAQESIKNGIPAPKAIESLAKGLRKIGEKFNKMEVFLSDLYLAAETMQAGVKVLQDEIKEHEIAFESKGTIVIGTVKGDIHDIGKNIVATFLNAAGFKVIDIGKDISSSEFVDIAESVNADIIGASALLTSTIEQQRCIIEEVKTRGLQNRIGVFIGGTPATQDWADEIGADGYAKDGMEAVKVAEKFIKKRKR